MEPTTFALGCLVGLAAGLYGTSVWLRRGRPPAPPGFAHWDPIDRCPDCGSAELQEGPHGGMMVNRSCADCGARWNTVKYRGFGLIQRI